MEAILTQFRSFKINDMYCNEEEECTITSLQADLVVYSKIKPLQLFRLRELTFYDEYCSSISEIYDLLIALEENLLILTKDLLIHEKEPVQPPGGGQETAVYKPMNYANLLKLMSILPDHMAADCKCYMDRDEFQWKINLELIASVFINWGVDLRILNLNALFEPYCGPTFCTESLPHDEENPVIPASTNLSLVLDAMRHRIPSDQEMPVHEKNMILKMLIWGTLDKRQKLLSEYIQAIKALLMSYDNLDSTQIRSILEYLDLRSLREDQAAYVVCYVLDSKVKQFYTLELVATVDALNRVLGHGFMEKQSLAEVIESLNKVILSVDSYTKKRLHRISLLLGYLIYKSHYNSTLTKETLTKALDWIKQLQGALEGLESELGPQALDGCLVLDSLSRLRCDFSVMLKMNYP